ncbi:hypothetical protein BDK51DRAFT_50802 [Blyttiomyces helicus]|uniref:Uncharacterized protein n=1 Tax=Blyttiomyces helicus TaxID=388810 RepID=A0A4P9W5N5_9FUNG|nr:hypothetical protein BDK51DRAFT_50802 [Blyttiomyces helicus]|eukprot:RKO87731.1 hypothetical protein BDK51DRAFT_50802 [Blyttiomyces helicus]
MGERERGSTHDRVNLKAAANSAVEEAIEALRAKLLKCAVDFGLLKIRERRDDGGVGGQLNENDHIEMPTGGLSKGVRSRDGWFESLRVEPQGKGRTYNLFADASGVRDEAKLAEEAGLAPVGSRDVATAVLTLADPELHFGGRRSVRIVEERSRRDSRDLGGKGRTLQVDEGQTYSVGGLGGRGGDYGGREDGNSEGVDNLHDDDTERREEEEEEGLDGRR